MRQLYTNIIISPSETFFEMQKRKLEPVQRDPVRQKIVHVNSLDLLQDVNNADQQGTLQVHFSISDIYGSFR